MAEDTQRDQLSQTVSGSRLGRFFRRISYTVPWNLFLISIGSVIAAFALKSIAIPFGLISGGLGGTSLLLYYLLGTIDPGLWFYILNIPIFLIGWIFISRRFFLYSLYGTLCVGALLSLIDFTLPITEPILAVLAGGTCMGAGVGLALRSLGSTGGLDIIAVILNQKFNLRMGQVFFYFNLSLFIISMLFLDLDIVLYSLGFVFISGSVTDYFLSMFNQRKMVLVISNRPEEIAQAVLERIHRGATFIYGEGAFSGTRKKIVLTVVNNIQLKRLEEVIFTIDPHAFTIIGNTWNVLGSGFSTRKVY